MTADKPTPKPALIPKLRFPEFRNEPEWKPAQLSSVAHFVNDRVSVSAIAKDEYVSTENILPNFAGIAPPSSFPASGSVTRFCINDVLIANIRPYLKKVWRATRNGGASNDVLVVRKKSDTSADYLAALLQSDAFIDYVMVGAKGVKMPRGDISLIRQYPVSIPKPAEQRKIADCLGSLDDLIAAEGQKLETLKTHKKGLLQQLFPRPGETTPRLRFPEFRDAGEWDESPLSRLSNIVRGGSPRPIDAYITHDPDGLNWLKIGDVPKEAKYITRTEQKVLPEAISKTRVVSPGDFILSNSMSFGRPYISKIQTCIHDGWIAVTELTSTVDRDFLYYLMMSDQSQRYFENQAAGGGVRNLTVDIVKLLPVWLPEIDEQQKIADCLSSLDDLIAAEGRKLETLKVHKQGLLQQLFPAMTGPSI